MLYGCLGYLSSCSWLCWPGKCIWLFLLSSSSLSGYNTCLCFCLPSSRMIDIQTKMAERALELLNLPDDKPCYLLDIGWDPGAQADCPGRGAFLLFTLLSPCLIVFSSCGTGLSGDYLTDEGHFWVGIDISPAMLGKYVVFSTAADYTHEYGTAYAYCLVSFILLWCRCSLGPRSTRRPASGGHGPGHPL